MTRFSPDELGETPTVVVRVYRDGALVAEELCESEEAAAVVDAWSEVEGVELEVDDLAVRHRQGQILEPGPDDAVVAGQPQPEHRDEGRH